MTRHSTTRLIIDGMVIGLIASGLAALTHTGILGLYGFGLLGALAGGTILMWPERTRFFIDHSATPKHDDER